jgi:hypothetical protein
MLAGADQRRQAEIFKVLKGAAACRKPNRLTLEFLRK